jgi:hypothetical protein
MTVSSKATLFGRQQASIRKSFRGCRQRIVALIFGQRILVQLRDRRVRRNIAMGILLILVIVWILPFLKTRRVDHMLTYWVMAKVFASQQAELKAMGITDLPMTKIDYANDINTHASLRELLIRREIRAEHLQRLEAHAEQCRWLSSADPPFERNCNDPGLPRYLFVPNIAGWLPMRPPDLLTYNLTSISFVEIEMKQLVDQTVASLNQQFGNDDASTLRSLYYQFSPLDRIHIWALSAIFLYGGVFLGSLSPRWQTKGSTHLTSIFGKIEKSPTAAYYAYSRNPKTQMRPSGTIELLAAAAGHPVIASLLYTVAVGVSPTVGVDAFSVFDILDTAMLANMALTNETDWWEASLSNPVVGNGMRIGCPLFFVQHCFAHSVLFSYNAGQGRLHTIREFF